MITASLFREMVMNGCIGKVGVFRLLLSKGRHADADQVATMLHQGDASRILSYEELLTILPDLEVVLNLIPEMMVTVLEVSENDDKTIVAMGTVDGWEFTKERSAEEGLL